MPTTPDKTPGSHRMRLLERRLAPNTPITPITPATPNSHQSDDDHPHPRLSVNAPIPSAVVAAPPPSAPASATHNPDKPESVQSFASDESTPTAAATAAIAANAPSKAATPAAAAPSPPQGVRKQRRRGGATGGGTKKNSKNAPPTKRRLGRLDEFFTTVSATNNNNNNNNNNNTSNNNNNNNNNPSKGNNTNNNNTSITNTNSNTNVNTPSSSATTTPHAHIRSKRPVSPGGTPTGLVATTTPITPASSLGAKTPSPRHHAHGAGGETDTPAAAQESYRYLRALADRLKKEKEVLRETVDEIRGENEDLQAQVDLELPQLRQSLAEREDEVRRLTDDLEDARQRNQRLRDALRETAAQGERWRRQSLAHVTNANCERLGRIVVARGGVKNPFGEAWQDGREWKQVSDELASVRAEREAVEKRARRRKRRRVMYVQTGKKGDDNHHHHAGASDSRSLGDENLDANIDDTCSTASRDGMGHSSSAGLRSRHNTASSAPDEKCDDGMDEYGTEFDEGGVGHDDDDDDTSGATTDRHQRAFEASGVEADELLHVRTQALRARESKLSAKLGRLEAERELLVREVRRQNDERNSQFGDMPVLHRRYVLLNLLGRGGFSEVFRAVDLDTGGIVACKIHQLASNWAEEKKRNFIKHAMREYHIHKELRHSRVVRMLDIFEIDDNSFGTVLQYCDGCDLDAYLRERKMLSEREARAIIGQVFSGLLYLSQPGRRIIHYDLKPANILLSKGRVQITDFGLSKIMGDGETTRDGMELTSQGAGTMWYLPPECFDPASEARINSKVDVWSAGVILFQMLYGRKPFGHDLSQERIFRDKTVQKEDLIFPDTPAVSDTAKDFIRTCLTRRVSARPDVRQMLSHPFLKRSTPPSSSDPSSSKS